MGLLLPFTVKAQQSCLNAYQVDVVQLQFESWIEASENKSQKLEELVTKAAWEQLYYLGTGMTETYLVKYAGAFSGIFKPYGEFWRHKDKAKSFATNPKAEVLAYKISQLTGLGKVPLTVFANIKGMQGSLQLFIPKNEDLKPQNWEAMVQELKLFDYLINNTDRRADNILPAEGFLVAIDHSQSFKIKDPLLSDSEIKKIISDLPKQKLQKLSSLNAESLLKISDGLISHEEQQALLQRFYKIRDYLLKN